jgi:polysaccharide lyase-like protein
MRSILRSVQAPVALLLSAMAACAQRSMGPSAPTALEPPGSANTIFSEDFESGTLSAWQDGVDPARQRVVTDPGAAQSGSRYLSVTYPAGLDGGWLTRFFMPGYDSMYVSYYVRLAANWEGGTKLVALYGSRIDNQWSGFGKAGVCPNGTDFFAAMVITENSGSPGPVRFYTYYPGMAREPGGTACFGRFGDGTGSERGVVAADYGAPVTLTHEAWHHVEFWVSLNTPGRADGRQVFWIDGEQRGSWSGLSFRTSAVLRLNAVQLSFNSGATGVAHTQELDVDNLVVRAGP